MSADSGADEQHALRDLQPAAAASRAVRGTIAVAGRRAAGAVAAVPAVLADDARACALRHACCTRDVRSLPHLVLQHYAGQAGRLTPGRRRRRVSDQLPPLARAHAVVASEGRTHKPARVWGEFPSVLTVDH